ncbi:hypothetical protein VCSRO105_0670 [Vibrio cholerae]|nr:hypothetical protein VCSRO105_0670 [Vibrio cholerae]
MVVMPMKSCQLANGGEIMDINEFVSDMLKDATESELKDIIVNGIQLDDCDMLEALENEFLSQAKEKLSNAKH